MLPVTSKRIREDVLIFLRWKKLFVIVERGNVVGTRLMFVGLDLAQSSRYAASTLLSDENCADFSRFQIHYYEYIRNLF